MALRIIALIKDGKKDVGYRLYDEVSGAIGNFNLKDANIQLKHYGCSNATMENGKLVGTECSLDRFAVMDRNLNLIKEGGIIVLGRIVEDNETIGYSMINIKGEKINLKRGDALVEINKYGVSNASKVTKDGKVYLRGIKKDIPIVKCQDIFKSNTYNNSNDGSNSDVTSELCLNVHARNKHDYVVTAVLEIKNVTENMVNDLTRLVEHSSDELIMDISSKNKSFSITSDLSEDMLIDAKTSVMSILDGLKLPLNSVSISLGAVASNVEDSYCDITSYDVGKLSDVNLTEKTYSITVSDCIKSCSADLTLTLESLLKDNCEKSLIQNIKKDLSVLGSIISSTNSATNSNSNSNSNNTKDLVEICIDQSTNYSGDGDSTSQDIWWVLRVSKGMSKDKLNKLMSISWDDRNTENDKYYEFSSLKNHTNLIKIMKELDLVADSVKSRVIDNVLSGRDTKEVSLSKFKKSDVGKLSKQYFIVLNDISNAYLISEKAEGRINKNKAVMDKFLSVVNG